MAEMTAEEREDIRRGVQEGELIVEFGAPGGESWLEVEACRRDVATKAWWSVKVRWLKRGCVQRQSLPEEGIEAHLVELFETLLGQCDRSGESSCGGPEA